VAPTGFAGRAGRGVPATRARSPAPPATEIRFPGGGFDSAELSRNNGIIRPHDDRGEWRRDFRNFPIAADFATIRPDGVPPEGLLRPAREARFRVARVRDIDATS
jgi:hypothetical protein